MQLLIKSKKIKSFTIFYPFPIYFFFFFFLKTTLAVRRVYVATLHIFLIKLHIVQLGYFFLSHFFYFYFSNWRRFLTIESHPILQNYKNLKFEPSLSVVRDEFRTTPLLISVVFFLSPLHFYPEGPLTRRNRLMKGGRKWNENSKLKRVERSMTNDVRLSVTWQGGVPVELSCHPMQRAPPLSWRHCSLSTVRGSDLIFLG